MKAKYSIALIPSEEVIVLVDSIKKELAEKIEWFHSKNSKAHITISEFEATEEEAKSLMAKVKAIADTIEPVMVSFESFDSFPNGAFYISPNEVSKDELKKIMKRFHNATKPFAKVYKSSEPHISIGRKIDEEKLKIAIEMFKTINFSFNCDTVAIRFFDDKLRQYKIKEKYCLNGNPQNPIQTSLF